MAAKDYPHRSAIGLVQTDDMVDNLAIVLASDFEPGCESEELDESETWKQEAIDKTNRVLDAIHAIYEPQITALRKRVEELEGALAWVEPAMHALTSYESDCGEPLPEDRQIGKIDDSRNSASFRLYVGHIRRMHAALRAKGGDNGDA